MTIDGLSGMKVYQKYLIDTTFLPSNYPEALEFLIKGITHTISNNEWTTTLESLAIPKDPFGLQNNTEISKSRNSNTNPQSQGNLNAITGNNSLRQVLLMLDTVKTPQNTDLLLLLEVEKDGMLMLMEVLEHVHIETITLEI
jgi:hypothetical protein